MDKLIEKVHLMPQFSQENKQDVVHIVQEILLYVHNSQPCAMVISILNCHIAPIILTLTPI